MTSNRTFYMHPTKCGGTSVAKCLEDLDMLCLFASKISLSDATEKILRSSEQIIFHGHITHIPKPRNSEERRIRHEIVNILYSQYNIIVPTRNPSNILQSWMHYSKNRATQVLDHCIKSRQNNPKNKERNFLFKMSKLKQNCLTFSEGGASITARGPDFPVFDLKEQDEEENLNAYADLMMTRTFINEMCSMQLQLFYPIWKDIKEVILRGQAYKLKLPLTNDNRQILYYNSEKIDASRRATLDTLVCQGFSDRLLRVRENSSIGKPRLSGSEFSSINLKLNRIIPGEWQIYNQSKSH